LLHEVFGARAISSLPDQVGKQPRRQEIVELSKGRVVALGVTIHREISWGDPNGALEARRFAHVGG
jgi:hypothetical protein